MKLYLTPAAIGYVTQLVLALVITAYLLHRLRGVKDHHQDRGHLHLATGVFVTVTVLVLLLLGDAALAPTPRLLPVYVENTVIGALITLLLQFAYAFPRRYPQRRREAQLALVLSLAYTLWEAGFALYRGQLLLHTGQVLYRPIMPDYIMVLLFLCIPVAFLRQTTASASDQSAWHALWQPQTRVTRANRAFALIFLVPMGLSLLTIGRDLALVHPAIFQSGMSAGILLTQFLFALNYLNALPTMISFQVRFVGITLLVVLAVFGIVGGVMTPPHAALYRPVLVEGQSSRFTPNAQGGYDVTPVASNFDADVGTVLTLDTLCSSCGPPDAQAAVPFTFPFYGQTVETLWVLQSGAVGVGAPLHVPSMEYHYATTPAIFPLFVTMNNAAGGVFTKDEDERLTITWQDLQGWHDSQATYTFQLVLQRDGVFTSTLHTLPDVPYDPNTSPFSNVWVTGATPGLWARQPQRVNFADAPLQSGPQGLLQDHYLEFRQDMHALLAPLAVLILAASAGVVGGFPLLFYIDLVRPLNALLHGVERLEAGEYAVAVPVHQEDEIGFLTHAFNDLAGQLGDLIENLEARVQDRTAELDAANEQLRAEIATREELITELKAFSHTVAHDLKAPLAVITGYSHLIMDDLTSKGETELVTFAEQLVTMSLKMGDMVEGILSFASIRQADVVLCQVDMQSIVTGVLLELQTLITQTGARLSHPDQWPEAWGNTQWAGEIWTNYVTNALKYGGWPAEGRAPVIELGYDRCPDGTLRFWVRDHGYGLTPEQQSQLFTPFSRLHKGIDNGSGLGLSIVKRMVEKMGGEVGVESAPGEGSRFWFTLSPCTESDPVNLISGG